MSTLKYFLKHNQDTTVLEAQKKIFSFCGKHPPHCRFLDLIHHECTKGLIDKDFLFDEIRRTLVYGVSNKIANGKIKDINELKESIRYKGGSTDLRLARYREPASLILEIITRVYTMELKHLDQWI